MSFLRHENTEYQCFDCTYTSGWDFAFTTHIRRYHHEISLDTLACFAEIDCYQCELCGYRTGSRVEFLQHMKWERLTELFLVDIKSNIADGFIKQEPLNIRTKIQFNAAEYQCLHCGLLTFSKLYVMKHSEKCKVKLQYLLNKSKHCFNNEIKKQNCDYKAKQRNKLKKQHENQKKFECYVCGYITKKNGNFNRHLINKHASHDEIDWFKCQHCQYRAKAKIDLKKHELIKHTIEEETEWFGCQECTYRSRVKYDLKRHQINKHTAHNKIKWFKCQDCEYQAKLNRELKKHRINKHTTEDEVAWFQCKECSYKSRVKYSLKRHQINKHTSHDDIEWFKCQDCDYHAKLNGELKKHRINKHTSQDKVMWFECQDCDIELQLKTHRINKNVLHD